MITKERLEELINQGSTIWSSGFNEEIKLNPKNCKVEKQKWQTDREPKLYLVVKEDEYHYPTYCLDNLREDVERAKWHLKNDIERIERFEPLLWDDIDTQYEFNFFDRQFIRPGIYSVRHMRLSAYNGDKDKEVYLYDETNKEYEIYEQHATKEDYEKACEIVRNLFNKEKK